MAAQNVHSYTSGNVTTAAWVELIASTDTACNAIEITDSSTKILILGVGAEGDEVGFCSVPVSGTTVVPKYLPKGVRISIKAIDATANAGFNIISLM